MRVPRFEEKNKVKILNMPEISFLGDQQGSVEIELKKEVRAAILATRHEGASLFPIKE